VRLAWAACVTVSVAVLAWAILVGALGLQESDALWRAVAAGVLAAELYAWWRWGCEHTASRRISAWVWGNNWRRFAVGVAMFVLAVHFILGV